MRDFEKDYHDFIHSKGLNPSKELDNRVLSYVKNELNPSHKKVFFKLLAIHGFIGFLTLIFCPQFNLSLTNNFELFHYFHHKFGGFICMSICGSIFLGSGAIFSSYILTEGELIKIKKTKFLHLLLLSCSFLGVFLLISPYVYLKLSMFWLLGAFSSGVILFEVNSTLRLRFGFFRI